MDDDKVREQLQVIVDDHKDAVTSEREERARVVTERLAMSPEDPQAYLDLCVEIAASYRRQADIIEANVERMRAAMRGEMPS